MNAATTTASVELLEPSGARRACTVTLPDEAPWWLELRGAGPAPLRARASDLFESLAEIRSTLEASHVQLLCQGACRDVLPSPMSRQSGGGRFAYRLRMGVPTRREDLVDIFAPADPDCLGTVQEQRAFASAWAVSLARG